MSSFLNWINMGGYSFYVWSAYGLAVVVLGGCLWNSILQSARNRKKLKHWFDMQKSSRLQE